MFNTLESWKNTPPLEEYEVIIFKDTTSLVKQLVEGILKLGHFGDSKYLFGVVIDSKLVGYVKVCLDTKGPSAEICYIEIESLYRKEGVAKKLLDSVFPFLVEKEIKYCWTQGYTSLGIYLIRHITFLSEKYDIKFIHGVQTC